MSDFKVGDKVRRIKGNYCDMRIGDTDIITGVVTSDYSPNRANINLKKYGSGHSTDSLIVIKTSWRERIEAQTD